MATFGHAAGSLSVTKLIENPRTKEALTDAQVKKNDQFFIKNFSGPMPAEMDTLAKQNRWIMEQVLEKFWVFYKTEVMRERQKERDEERAAEDIQDAIELGFE